ncbi:MAG: type II toxin-antitoxin system prevent-host-death family antitoxin [Elusimicrobiota bacterium]|jgi:prevent-host-death family protein|nr:type II toxin-antitoxin system prevent-host-death family antitoxin [Elusimicrobiota bacterium]
MNIAAFEVQNNFSQIIKDVQKGKDFIITEEGKPVAKIIPFSENALSRKEIVRQLIQYRKTQKIHFDIRSAIEDGRK